MEYKFVPNFLLELDLIDNIEEIFKIGKESFNNFYPRDKFLDRI